MLRVLIIVLPIALAIYALVDLVQTEEDDVQGLPKIAWVGVIVILGVVGPLAWILAGKKSRRILPRLLPPQPGAAGYGGGPVAPDDDPDFLRGLRRSSPPPRTPPAPPAPPTGPAADTGLGPDLEAFERELQGDDSAEDRDEQGPDDPPLTSR